MINFNLLFSKEEMDALTNVITNVQDLLKKYKEKYKEHFNEGENYSLVIDY